MYVVNPQCNTMWLMENVALVGSGQARLSNGYDCNVYAIDAPEGTILVDLGAGLETDRLLDRVQSIVGDPTAALLTHAHADHSQGGPDLPGSVTVYASKETAALTVEGDETRLGVDAAIRDGVYPENYSFRPFEPDVTFVPDEQITVAGQLFTAIRVRGHASDHVCYLTEINDRTVCFSGDVVAGDGSISLLNVPGSSLAEYRADLPKLQSNNVDALLTGHGLPRVADGQEPIELAAKRLTGMFVPDSTT